MRKALLAILLAVCPAICWAEPFLLDLPPGVHNLKITVAADGTVTASPLRLVTVGGGPTQPNPPPVDPTDPPPDTPLVTQVEALTRGTLITGGTKTSGAAIASIYSLASVEVSAGRLDPLKAFDFTAKATETILGFQTDKVKWDPFRKDLAGILTPMRDSGGLMTKEQVSSVMRQIAAGMDKATGFDSSPKSIAEVLAATPAEREAMGLFDGIDIAKIIELIKLIITLLSLFGIGG